MNDELLTVIDFIRYAASRMASSQSGLGHGHESYVDEANHLVLSALHLPPDLPPALASGRLLAEEKAHIRALLDKRVNEHIPVAYLVGEAWFAGLSFKSDARALVPRSPFAELIEHGFSPWLDGHHVTHALDMCTGSGCIGLAMAAYQPDWQVDLADISDEALTLARENRQRLELEDRADIIQSNLFAKLEGKTYDLIVSNPPYVTEDEYQALPNEYLHEPKLGLTAGADGLDMCLRLLHDAPQHLNRDGLLMVEVGASEQALIELLPRVPFVWLDFSVGALGVFVLGYDDLLAHQPDIQAALRERGL